MGEVLSAITFTVNTILFSLGNDSISVESEYSYRIPPDTYHDMIPVQNTRVVDLIGKIVQAVETPDIRTLQVQFDNGRELIIKDSSDIYESFSIQIGDRRFII